ncbi:MAG: PrsW family intramembrane metalloprotease [Verrucomicrobiales bacterium]|nr:PrsW family intramembrane metalloprotease [Verrucomicrobiales bacterium]
MTSCFLLDAQGRPVGPYSIEDLSLFLQRGMVAQDTPVLVEGSTDTRPLGSLLRPEATSAAFRPPPSAPAHRPPLPPGNDGEAGTSAGRDFLRLAPHLMLPLEDLARLRAQDSRRILALAVIGLLPLFLVVYLQGTNDLGGAYWGIALYSSLLWALFFHATFSQPAVTLVRCVWAYVGSAVFSVGLVALARYVVPVEWVAVWIQSPSLSTRWAGHLVGVAAIEELSKLFVLYFLAERTTPQRAVLFYGLMAGLGFGIFEGVAYQSSQNLLASFPSGQATAKGAGLYYVLNFLRLTSLPFLHAMWTGIAAYFVGFALHHPSRRGGYLIAALAVPSLLHATYNTFADTLVGVTVALVTVLALNLYLLKGRDFETALAQTLNAGPR